MPRLPTGTLTFLLTDLEGSTRLVQHLGDAASERVFAEHRRILQDAVESADGHVYQDQGESFLFVFQRAKDAILASLAAQRALLGHPWPEGATLRVRMGLHSGEPALSGEEYVGIDIHRTARICQAGDGGQILVSQTTRDLVEANLPADTTLRDLGAHRLKDLQGPEHIFQIVHAALPAEFPPLKSLDSRPNNLPTQPTPLIGREREVVEARARLLRDHDIRLLTLSGPGGAGKTRLALQVAAEALEDFAHGVFFVNLAAVHDGNLVAPAIAQALGLQEARGRSVLAILQDYLRDKQTLLVLDNFEQVLTAGPIVADLLAVCSGVKALVTSRSTLHLRGEQEFPVMPLALPDRGWLQTFVRAGRAAEDLLHALSGYGAIALFIARAQGVKPEFRITPQNALTVAEICYRLDGLPLAIELAATRIKVLPPEGILARLESRLRLLTGGPRDLPARQQTLRDAIAWSYDLLDERERQLFRQVSVFAGGFTLPAAERVCDSAVELAIDVFDGVASLVDKSLLRQIEEAGEPRYVMLETVREFGLERLAAAGELETTRNRHLDFLLGLAEDLAARAQAAEPGVDTVAQLEREHDNLRAALTWSRDLPDGGIFLRLTAAMGWFWYRRGHCTEGRAWVEEALARTEPLGRTLWRARALQVAGMIVFCQGDMAQARAFHEQSAAIASGLGDRELLAFSQDSLGIVLHILHGTPDLARPHYDESLAIFRELGHKRGIARALSHLSYVDADSTAARSHLEECLAIAREMGDKALQARALLGLGVLASRERNYAAARPLMEESLALRRQTGETWGLAATLDYLGPVARHQGDDDRAAAVYEESLTIYRNLGNRPGMASALRHLGEVALHQNDIRRASTLFEESLALHRTVGNRPGLIECIEGLAGVAAAGERYERTARLFGAAQALHEIIGHTPSAYNNAKHDRDVAAARAAMGDAAFDKAHTAGRAMTLEQAIEYALGEEK